MNTSFSKQSYIKKEQRYSLYVVNDDLQFLEQLKKEVEYFSLDLICQSNPIVAMEQLQTEACNPKIVILSQSYLGTPITGYQIMQTMKKKPRFFPTMFGMIIEGNLDERLEGVKLGINYMFEKPVSPHALLQALSDALQSRSLKHPHVLVLDDDPEVCRFITSALEKTGMAVRAIHDPRELYPTLKEYAPHVLLLDVLLPDYNGLELLKTLRADLMYKNLLIVIITTIHHFSVKNRAYLDHADAVLHKPLDKTLLQNRIHCLIDRYPLPDQQWTGLKPLTTLVDQLYQVAPKCDLYHLVLLEIDHFSDLTSQYGHPEAYKLLISMSNVLLGISNHKMSCYYIDASRFAILCEEYDRDSLKHQVTDICLEIRRETERDIAFSCAILPLSSAYTHPHDTLLAAEKVLEQARQQEHSVVKVAVYGPKEETERKKEVVLIDPDEELLELVKKAFERHNFSVKTFRNGTKALNDLLDCHESALPSLIIAERKLPDMDGLAVLNTLKACFHEQISFYFLTVYSSDKDVSEGLAHGALEYITKPFNLTLLMQKALTTISHPKRVSTKSENRRF